MAMHRIEPWFPSPVFRRVEHLYEGTRTQESVGHRRILDFVPGWILLLPMSSAFLTGGIV